MESLTACIGIFGSLLIVILLAYKIKSSFIFGIGIVTIISWFRETSVSYIPDDAIVPDDAIGDERFSYLKEIVAVQSLSMITGKIDFSGVCI